MTVADIMAVAAQWGTADPLADVNDDGTVDIADVQQVAGHWRKTCHVLAETTKYYHLGGRRVAMRREPAGQASTLYYLFTDHLGSTSVSYRSDGSDTRTQRYYPWGTIRSGGTNALPTDYTFTGQKLDEPTGLMYYGARWYEPALGRFIQPDTIVPDPGNPQSLSRYTYAGNNPLRYRDSSGHCLEVGLSPIPCEVVFQEGMELAQQAEALAVQYGPAAMAFLQANIDKLPALWDRMVQFAREAGNRLQQNLQGGEAGSPGGLDPNDPLFRFYELINRGIDPVEAAVRASTQGSGDRFVIGPYDTPPGVSNYIEEAQLRGGRYFDAGPRLWNELKQMGLTEEVNRRVIYEQMKAGISRIDLSSGQTIEYVLKFRSDTWTAMEIRWVQELARGFGYVENATGTGWIKVQ